MISENSRQSDYETHLHILHRCSLTLGCSTPDIKNLEHPTFMPREQVIQASEQCEAADMRPRLVYGFQIVQDRRVSVPIDVQCEPSSWRKSK